MFLLLNILVAVIIGATLTPVRADSTPISLVIPQHHIPPHLRKTAVNNESTCRTSECIATAKEILDDIDLKMDPCQDFSQFVCGGFYKKKTLPENARTIDYFELMLDKNDQTIREIVDPSLNKTPTPPKDDKAAWALLKKLQDFYASCMDEAEIHKIAKKTLLAQIDSILAIAPPASPNVADKKTLAKTIAALINRGLSGLVKMGVMPDPKNPRINVLRLQESGVGRPKEDMKDPEKVKKYEEGIARVFNLVYSDNDTLAFREPPITYGEVDRKWKDLAKDLVEFEKQLSAVGVDLIDRYNPLKNNNPRTVAQLSQLVPEIDWPTLISGILPSGVKNTRWISVECLSYLSGLGSILSKTKAETLRHYFTWVVISRSPQLMEGAGLNRTIHLDYNFFISNNHSTMTIYPDSRREKRYNRNKPDFQLERWKTCVSQVNEHLGDMAGHFFIQTNFKGDSQNSASAIIDSILQTCKRTFPTLKWLDRTTLKGATKKLGSFIRLIGFSTTSPNVASSKSLLAFYSGYHVTKTDYFGNLLQSDIWSTKKRMEELNKPVNRKRMPTYPQMVNAFYSPASNQIIFPAGILQTPFFNVDNPDYLNYGGFGVVAGHEITHGFDNIGRHYDGIGRLKNWWTQSTIDSFNKRSQCLVDQYGNFTIKDSEGNDHYINGRLTLGENIADNGGIKYSYRAWQYRLKSDLAGKKYKNFQLSGLENYSREQLFFISYGRLWCAKERPDQLVRQIEYDPHTPAKWRINGVVQNSKDFAKAFSCPIGAPMNPVKKCEVW
ncbi:hypothetical protein FBU30_006031 [Linnemannia zychae]|nr:hypothetical protein FBU30_006031 [Linnemannia zychae]